MGLLCRNPEEQTQPFAHIAHDFRGRFSGSLGVARRPVHTAEVVSEYRADNLTVGGKRYFKWITLCVTGDWIYQRQAGLPVVA